MATITTANREYARRPKDECYPSLAALSENAAKQKARSGERTYSLRDLKFKAEKIIVPGGGDRTTPAKEVTEVRLVSPAGKAAKLTHWAFGQACSLLQSPAAYLRDGLSAEVACDALNYRISQAENKKDALLLIEAGAGTKAEAAKAAPTIRSITGKSYGRVWDADLYGGILETLAKDGKWQLPPTWSGEPRGAYRGDRDSFLILCEGGSIVTDPTLTSKGNENQMFRALMVRNSEVGAASVSIERILYRYVCGNHMLWGAMVDKRYKRRHVGRDNVMRDTMREVASVAYDWRTEDPKGITEIIKLLADKEIAHTDDAVVDELVGLGMTEEEANKALNLCEKNEQVSSRTWWGAVQGITRMSQESGHQDERLEWDLFAAQVLAKGRQLVAA